MSNYPTLSSLQRRPKRPREEYDTMADWEDRQRNRRGWWGHLSEKDFCQLVSASYSEKRQTKREKIEIAISSFFDNIKVFLILFEIVGIFVVVGISGCVLASGKEWEDLSPFLQWYSYIIIGVIGASPWVYLLNSFISSRFGTSLWDILVSPFESLRDRILDRFFPPVIRDPSLDTMVRSSIGSAWDYFFCRKVFRFLAFFPTITDFLPRVKVSKFPLQAKDDEACELFCQEYGLNEKEKERLREVLSRHTPPFVFSENFGSVFFLKKPKDLDILSAAARAFYRVPRFLWEGPWGPERLLFLMLAFGRDFPSLREKETEGKVYLQVCERDLGNWVTITRGIFTQRDKVIHFFEKAIREVLERHAINEIKTLADFCAAMGCVAKPEWERDGIPLSSGLSSEGLDMMVVLSSCLDGLKNEDTLWTEVYLSLQRVLSEAGENTSEESHHTYQTPQ
ncbi:hypothetical protein BREVNS_1942 [Brevinematales bacterium NS]|nr:hypothetical protein BREVNS_1942 [Brevinematales bacterium NS]